MNKPTAIFIGTKRSLMEPVFHEVTARLQAEDHAQWGSALKAIEDSAPWLVLVTGTADNPDPRGFLEALRERIPHCMVPAIAIDLMARRLTLQRWDREAGGFSAQVRPVNELGEVLAPLLEPTVAPQELAPLRDAGFYNHVTLGGRTLHVQTEVLMRDRARIKSTVHEGGRILYGTSQILPLDVSTVEQGQVHVRSQHDVVMELVGRRRW